METADDKVKEAEMVDERKAADQGKDADDVKEVELVEERKAAEGKSRKISLEVTQLPKVNRNKDGSVTSVTVTGKAPFKGEVTLRLRGDVASAYWSVTPGMRLSARVFERADGDYDVDTMDLLSRG